MHKCTHWLAVSLQMFDTMNITRHMVFCIIFSTYVYPLLIFKNLNAFKF